MIRTSLDVFEYWGCICVVDEEMDDVDHRWWFEVESNAAGDSVLVFVEEVVAFQEDAAENPWRFHVGIEEAEVPRRVQNRLEAEGFDVQIVDCKGRVVEWR